MTAKTKNIPAHAAVAAKGVDYAGASAGAAAALNAWGAQVGKLEGPAFMYQGYKNNRAMFINGDTILSAANYDSLVENFVTDSPVVLVDLLCMHCSACRNSPTFRVHGAHCRRWLSSTRASHCL